MFKRSNLIAIAAALTVGAASFAATASASAAPGLGFAQIENSVQANVEQVGGKHKGKGHGHGGKRHHRRHGKHKFHGGGFGFYPGYHGVYVGAPCFYKTFKEWDPYVGAWVIIKKQVCY